MNFKVFTTFAGIIKKVQTTSSGDGDYRITIDVPRQYKDAVKELLDVEGMNEVCGFAVSKAPKKERTEYDSEDAPY